MAKQLATTNVGAIDLLNSMREVLALYKVLTNFEVHEFDELASIVCPTICDNVCSTCLERL